MKKLLGFAKFNRFFFQELVSGVGVDSTVAR
jgi:hypothetical protein